MKRLSALATANTAQFASHFMISKRNMIGWKVCVAEAEPVVTQRKPFRQMLLVTCCDNNGCCGPNFYWQKKNSLSHFLCCAGHSFPFLQKMPIFGCFFLRNAWSFWCGTNPVFSLTVIYVGRFKASSHSVLQEPVIVELSDSLASCVGICHQRSGNILEPLHLKYIIHELWKTSKLRYNLNKKMCEQWTTYRTRASNLYIVVFC